MNPDFFRHPFSKLLMLVFIMITSFFVMFLLGYLLAVPIFGMSFGELSQLLSGQGAAHQTQIIKYFQIIQTIGLFVVPPFVAVRFFSDNPSEYLGFSRHPRGWSIVAVVLLIWMAVPFINFLTWVNQEIHLPETFGPLEDWLMSREENARELTSRFLKADTISMLLVNVLMVGVLPAVGEELVFRGLIQKLVARWTRNVHLGIVIAAFLFSAMHVQFYGLLPRMFLGMLFGYLLLWSGSIWLPIVGHFVNNTSAVVYYYLWHDEVAFSTQHFEAMGRQLPAVAFSVVMILLSCWIVYMNEKRLKG